jgi:hypothetical protein
LPSVKKTLGKEAHSAKKAECKKTVGKEASLPSAKKTLGKELLCRVFFFAKCLAEKKHLALDKELDSGSESFTQEL